MPDVARCRGVGLTASEVWAVAVAWMLMIRPRFRIRTLVELVALDVAAATMTMKARPRLFYSVLVSAGSDMDAWSDGSVTRTDPRRPGDRAA